MLVLWWTCIKRLRLAHERLGKVKGIDQVLRVLQLGIV
jgi:hypothetical protein